MNNSQIKPCEPRRQEGHSEIRQRLFSNLLSALWTPAGEKESTPKTFAACGALKNSEQFSILKSFHVDGAGEVRLPLSAKDISTLGGVCEQAPVVGSNVGRCLQVDASKVTFSGTPEFLPNIIQALATKAVGALGLDGAARQLEVHLSNVLLYEAGSHFTFHNDTETEKGTFATLLLQLPTDDGYSGGKLVVKHFNAVKEFDCHMVSAIGFCYTVFFTDCLHEIQKIEFGTRVCLAFNLVKRDFQSDFIASRVNRVQVALQPWLKAVTEGRLNIFGRKLAIPLQHKYKKDNLSFDGLKGEDNIVAELLKTYNEKNEEKLDLHLCLVSKHIIGDIWDPNCEEERLTMNEVMEENIKIRNWIGLNGTSAFETFPNLVIDMEKETVVRNRVNLFGDKPDEVIYDNENYGCDVLEHCYYAAMVVVWPKRLSISVACEVGVSSALDLLESSSQVTDPSFTEGLHQIVCYIRNNASQLWKAEAAATEDLVTPRILNLCVKTNVPEDVKQILQFLAKSIHFKPNLKGGVRNISVAREIAAAVQAFGWETFSSLIINLVKECAVNQGESFLQLAQQFTSMGMDDAGAMVAKAMCDVFEARIAALKSHKMPEFTWHQPLAKLPEYPAIETFLQGPQETHVHTGFKGLPKARSFAEKHFRSTHSTTNGYSATATPGGLGSQAFCVIKKTRSFFDGTIQHWRHEQEEIERLKLELEKLRVVVPQIQTVNVDVTTFVGGSGKCGNKRQRVDTDQVTEVSVKRAKSSAVEVTDLS